MKHPGVVGLMAVITLTAIAAIGAAGAMLNASYVESLIRGQARTGMIIRGIEYERGGIKPQPLRMEERDMWLGLIRNDTVALKDIVMFKEGVQKMYSETKDYMDFLSYAYRTGSVRNSYGWEPYYKDYILRFDTMDMYVVTFPKFNEIPEQVYKRSLGDWTDGINVFLLDTPMNRELYGLSGLTNEIGMEHAFNDSTMNMPESLSLFNTVGI